MALSNRTVETWYFFMFMPNVFFQIQWFLNKFANHPIYFITEHFIAFTFIGLLGSLFFLIPTEVPSLETINYAKKKIFKIKIFLGFIILYTLIITILFKDLLLTISAIIMCLSIGIYIKAKFLALTSKQKYDYRERWRKAQSGVSEDSPNPNFTWRFKFFTGPKIKLEKNRKPSILPYTYNWIFGALLLSATNVSIFFKVLTLIVFFGYLIEYNFNLYFEFTGFCTDVIYSPRNGTDRYTVYIVDYQNQREIKYLTYTKPYFASGDYTRAIVGVITRRVVTASRHSRTTY